jgi:hypothetical protein
LDRFGRCLFFVARQFECERQLKQAAWRLNLSLKWNLAAVSACPGVGEVTMVAVSGSRSLPQELI